MAIPICAPWSDDGTMLNRAAGETDEDFLAAVQERAALSVREGIDNSDKANFRRQFNHLKNMSGMSGPAVEQYVERVIKGYGRGKVGKDPMADIMASNVVSAMEAYWMQRGAGIKQMATNFKIAGSEGPATMQALAFLQQLTSFNNMAQTLAVENLRAGGQLRVRGLKQGVEDAFAKSNIGGFAEGLYENPKGLPQYDLGEVQGILENIDAEKTAIREIADLIEAGDPRGLEKAMEVAKQIDFVDDPRDIAGMASRWKSNWNSWSEVYMNGLLMSPSTAVVNATGIAWVPLRVVLQGGFANAFLESGVGTTNLRAAAKEAAVDATAQLSAMQMAFQDSLKLGWRAMKTEKSIFQDTTQRITAENLRANNPLFKNMPAGEGIDQAINMLGSFIRLPTRIMLGMDETGKILGLRGQVASTGVRRAAMDGADLTDQKVIAAYIKREMEMAFDIDAGSLEKRYAFNPGGKATADSKADLYNKLNAGSTGRDVMMRTREGVFQESNKVARAVNTVTGYNAATQLLLKPFVPFVTTPLNILKQGAWESNPLFAVNQLRGAAFDAKANNTRLILEIEKRALSDPATAARIGGQISFMTLLAGTVWGMTQSGQLTGGGPESFSTGYNARRAQIAWEKAGNVPYSIDIGGAKIAIDRLGEPFATPMRIIANMGMYSGYMDRLDQDSSIAIWVGMASAGLYDASFLRGLDSFIRMFSGDPTDKDYQIANGIQNWVATQTPFGGLLAYVDRVNNPYQSAYDGASLTEMFSLFEVEMGKGIFGKLRAKIPGVEDAPMLLDQINGQGVPIVPGVGPTGLNAVQQAIPFFPRGVKQDDAWQAVYDITGLYTERKLGKDLQPTEKEQQQFNYNMANVKIGGKTLRQAILEFRARPEVQEFVRKNGVTLKGAGIKKEFNALFNAYAERARNQTIYDSPSLQERLAISKSINFYARGNDIGKVRELEEQLKAISLRAQRGY